MLLRPSTRVRPRPAFTLVEMLVVLGIIGILIALILPAVMAAQSAARRAAISLEIKQIESALETYKQQRGDYPPSFGEDYSSGNRNSTIVERHLQRCYPKMTAGAKNNFYTNIAPSLNQSQALVFWLGAVATSPSDPFQGSLNYPNLAMGDLTRNGYYEFDQRRLTTGSFPSYQAPKCRDTNYVYMEARTYTRHLSSSSAAAGVAQPYFQDNTGTTLQTLKPVNPNKFQIICAGLDGDFGNVLNNSGGSFSNLKLFVSGQNYNAGDRDNLTNFSDGRTLGDSRPQ